MMFANIPMNGGTFEGPAYSIQPLGGISTTTIVPALWVQCGWSAYDGDESNTYSSIFLNEYADNYIDSSFRGRDFTLQAAFEDAIPYVITSSIIAASFWSWSGTWDESTGAKLTS